MMMHRRLALSLVAMALSAVAHAGPDGRGADLVVMNADVYTAAPGASRAEAFAVRDGRFVAVGRSSDVMQWVSQGTRVVDARGATVTPGFIDGHAHLTGNAPRVAGVDLSYVVEKSAWLELVAEADKRLPDGDWMTGGYWDHTLSDGRYPDRKMLDAVVPDRPVFLTHIDGHYAWANTRALQLAGVTASSAVPPGGEIVLDPTTGEPTGILLEGAMSLVQRVIPERDSARRRAGLLEMRRYANSLGITGLHQMGGLEDHLHLIEGGDTTLRIWYGGYLRRDAGEGLDEAVEALRREREDIARRVAARGMTDTLGPVLALGYVKLFNDGVLSARTAVLLEDYADRHGWRGEYITSPGVLKHAVAKINAAGIPVAVHSIGDAAVRASLDAFEAARAAPPPLPNRIEHVEVVTPADIKRFRALGVVASMQPNHCTNAIGYVPARLGPARSGDAYVWRSMLSAGVPLVFGSDYPTSPLSPLVQIADAMFRSSPFGLEGGAAWFPQQALGFEEALLAFTRTPAAVTAWADEIGSIETGKWADFVVLSGRVPTPIDPSFRSLSVSATFFAGKQVYARPGP